jgi:hypothetical protein
MAKFKFTELPRATRHTDGGHPLVREFAAALQQKPGVWAVYPLPLSVNSARAYANSIKKGLATSPVALREGFGAATRAGVLYVRYIGDG